MKKKIIILIAISILGISCKCLRINVLKYGDNSTKSQQGNFNSCKVEQTKSNVTFGTKKFNNWNTNN